MQKLLVTAVSAHFSNFLTSPDLVAFFHKTHPVVGVRAEHFFTVFNDDQFTISDKAVATVDHLTGRCRDDFLTLLACNIQPIARWITSDKAPDHAPTGRPFPAYLICATACRLSLIHI